LKDRDEEEEDETERRWELISSISSTTGEEGQRLSVVRAKEAQKKIKKARTATSDLADRQS